MQKWILLLALLLPMSGSAIPADAEVKCDAPEGIPKAHILLFGEMHGSVETPALIGRIACQLASRGPTVLALEIGAQEQSRIDAFLASDGGAEARSALLEGGFWASNDGRSSQAKLELLDRVRTLQRQGLPLAVLAFIPSRESDSETVSHDERMARGIRAFHDAHPATRIVALMGNLHAGLEVIQQEAFRAEPAGLFLKDLDVVSVLVAHPAGSIWACMPECKVHPLPKGWGDDRAPGFTNAAPINGYAMSYVLPRITASPPARQHGSPAPD